MSNKGKGRMNYSINGQLGYPLEGRGMEERIPEIVFVSCLCGGGLKCFDQTAMCT